ncbi:MAG: hypothetical protein DRN30_05545 [Thermoplasmata archaeon]|nr:winged helix-turn-helix transcriptional regulator [Euryarchaeota archaeon]RLF64372.1 MAG: hypothetical protein DRN30_05545 [Thermoplasmata archaeon]
MDEKPLLERILRKLEKIEAMLFDMESRISVLEKALSIESDPILKRALTLAKVEVGLVYNLLDNVDVISKLPTVFRDDISIAIILSLLEGPKNISQITEDVKRMRGKSSRRIISEKLAQMETIGIVKSYRVGPSKYYELRIKRR